MATKKRHQKIPVRREQTDYNLPYYVEYRDYKAFKDRHGPFFNYNDIGRFGCGFETFGHCCGVTFFRVKWLKSRFDYRTEKITREKKGPSLKDFKKHILCGPPDPFCRDFNKIVVMDLGEKRMTKKQFESFRQAVLDSAEKTGWQEISRGLFVCDPPLFVLGEREWKPRTMNSENWRKKNG